MPDNNKLNLLLYWAILITFCTFDIEINAAIYTSKRDLGNTIYHTFVA